MKISVSTLPFYPQPLEKILDHIIGLNQGYCEIINEYPHDKFDLDVLNSYDIEFTIHAPLSDVNVASHNEGIRRSSIALIKNSMDLAHQMDSEIVVVHPGHMPILGRKIKPKILKFNRDSLHECSDYAQEVGLYMCVENMPDIDGLLYTDLDELSELIQDINAYMTLDVGHAHNNHYSAEDMLKYPLIKHVHLSDNDGSYDSHQAVGNDSTNGVDFKSLFSGLKKRGYDGFLVVEVEKPGHVKESVDFLDKNLENKRTIHI
ncbi:MAG TPA: sugar phosphate isomerase/epimerase [Methanobacterium sp.]|nr:sugar phosphate isomerase/epimerase [Methanobacterium sp.]